MRLHLVGEIAESCCQGLEPHGQRSRLCQEKLMPDRGCLELRVVEDAHMSLTPVFEKIVEHKLKQMGRAKRDTAWDSPQEKRE